MKIEVSENDIQRGIRDDCTRCPVAQAIRRALRGVMDLSGEWDVQVSCDSSITIRHMKYSIPYSVSSFIGKFDGNCLVAPFSFELPI